MIHICFHEVEMRKSVFFEKPRLKTKSFQNYKHFHLIDTSDKGFKGTVKNQALSFNIFAWRVP